MFKQLLGVLSTMITKKYSDISPAEFQQKMQEESDAVILDVRTQEELAEGSIDGYIMIDINQPSFPDKVKELDPEKTYLVYCRSGGRSGAACNFMAGQGFTKLYNLKGGIKAWNSFMS
jgi:rhodanese-related sulfurtransferase